MFTCSGFYSSISGSDFVLLNGKIVGERWIRRQLEELF